MHKLLRAVALGGVSILTCAAPSPAQLSDGDDILLRIDVEPRHTITLLEPEPGVLFFEEVMARNQKSILDGLEKLDATELFARLNPRQPVPEALREANDRAHARARNVMEWGSPAESLVPGAGGNPAPAPKHSSSSAAHFVNDQNGCRWGSKFSVCKVQWANGFVWQDVGSAMSCTIDHYSGDGITVQMFTDGEIPVARSLPVDQVGIFIAPMSGPRLLRRVELFDAAGDSFHIGCRWTE